MLSLFLAFILC